MVFNLNIKSAGGQLNFGKNSAIVKFFIDGDNLEKVFADFFESFGFKISSIQKEYFLDKKNDELVYHSAENEPAVIYLKKIKVDKKFSPDFFRNYVAGLLPSLKPKKLNSVHIVIPSFSNFPTYFDSDEYMVQSLIEGIHLGNYSFDIYKTEKKEISKLQLMLHYNDKPLLQKVIDKTDCIMKSVSFARDLVNEPAITLTPQEFAKRTKSDLSKHGIKVQIINKKELQKKKMNSILAVGGGSSNDPLMMVINYIPKKSNKKIALVGKGVSYDSGGLSIKPTSSMIDMKIDMAGGAAVVGIIKAAAMLKLPVELIGIIPVVENMVGGSSYKPGDIIRSYSGKTIEVKDTDAEGRIILADALHYASKLKPEEIIDFATLTGAVVVALGELAAGLFTESDAIAESISKSGYKTHERVWRMPFWNDYNSMIKSEIADVSNLGPRWGGSITAGKFLENFVDEKIPWAHIDIAGPAGKHDAASYTKKWETGFGIRLMTDYLEKI